jgi:hypothetical protein
MRRRPDTTSDMQTAKTGKRMDPDENTTSYKPVNVTYGVQPRLSKPRALFGLYFRSISISSSLAPFESA